MSLRQVAVATCFVAAAVLVAVAVGRSRRTAPAPALPPALPRAEVARAEGPAPTVLWTYRAGGRITSPVGLDARGRVYLTAHDGLLHVLEADGRLRFRRRLGPPHPPERAAAQPAWAAPLLLDDRLLVGSDAGVLWVFDLAGRPRGHRQFEGPVDVTPVALAGGGVLVVAGSKVTALGPGLQPRWEFQTRGKVFARPAVDARGGVYVAAQDDSLHALAADGQARWRHQAGGDLDAAPLLAHGAVHVGSDDGHVYSVELDGRRRWATPVGGHVRAPLALGGGGEIFAATFGPSPRLVALSPADGRVLWAYAPGVVDSSGQGFGSAPCVDPAGNVYLGGHDDRLHALDPGGALRFTVPVRGDLSGSPVWRDDGTLIFGTQSGTVYALDVTL